MKSLLAGLFALSFLAAATAHAEPRGNASGYWNNGRGSRSSNATQRISIPATPEPTGALLFAAGLIVAGAATRRRSAR
jgi:hypothetical protein